MKRIVLTVDDRCITDYTVIAPILKEYGFGCTFFITAKQNIWHGIRDIGDLTWEQIIQLHQDGFEIGNHTFDHFPITHGIERFEEEILLMEDIFVKFGIDKPVSVAYPGYLFDDYLKGAGREVLKRLGYQYARLGYKIDQWHYDPSKRQEISYYDPKTDDPFELYCTSILNNTISFEQVKQDIERVPSDKVAIVSTHYAQNSFEINRLHQLCRYIRDTPNLTMCRLKDLAAI